MDMPTMTITALAMLTRCNYTV